MISLIIGKGNHRQTLAEGNGLYHPWAHVHIIYVLTTTTIRSIRREYYRFNGSDSSIKNLITGALYLLTTLSSPLIPELTHLPVPIHNGAFHRSLYAGTRSIEETSSIYTLKQTWSIPAQRFTQYISIRGGILYYYLPISEKRGVWLEQPITICMKRWGKRRWGKGMKWLVILVQRQRNRYLLLQGGFSPESYIYVETSHIVTIPITRIRSHASYSPTSYDRGIDS